MFARAYRCGLLALGWLALVLGALPVAAQQITREVDYRVISQQPVASGERVEVIEFFFYGCPFCHELTPLLAGWLRRKPADVEFRRVPVVRHESWVPLAKTYYTLEAMGASERLHPAVYHSQHFENMSLSQENVIAEWAAKHGLDRERFLSIYRSDAVREKIERARQMTLDYEIKATPTLVVDGKFLTSSGMTEGVPQLLPVLDGLISLARELRLEKSAR